MEKTQRGKTAAKEKRTHRGDRRENNC